MDYRACAVIVALAGIGLFLSNAAAGAKSACRTVSVSLTDEGSLHESTKRTVTPCERIKVSFEIGTEGDSVATWAVSKKQNTKVLKLGPRGYERGDGDDGTATQYFLFRAVGTGRTSVEFSLTEASRSGNLGTFKLKVTVRR